MTKTAAQLDAEIASALRAKITEDRGDVVIEYYDDMEDRRVKRRSLHRCLVSATFKRSIATATLARSVKVSTQPAPRFGRAVTPCPP